ncbi:MAG: acyl carrier protein [Chloroflexota bacterium]
MSEASLAPAIDEHILTQLMTYWADTLDLPRERVAPSTDLFAHGADSMDLIYLESRIETMLDVDLPDFCVIEAPTPAEMAILVQERRLHPVPFDGPVRDAQLTWFAGGDPGVPPVFATPVGGAIATAWLARHVSGPRALANLRNEHPLPADPGLRDAWFEDLCQASVRRILAIDHHGPWRLLAECGVVSFVWETCRRLSLIGEPSLLLIDPWFPFPGSGSDDPGAVDPTHHDLANRPALPADFDLTLLLSPNWPHRTLAERYATLVSRPADVRLLPAATVGHALTADSIPAIAAEVQFWLASRDLDAPESPLSPVDRRFDLPR